MTYYKDGSISAEHYYLDNKKHRVDEPAEIYYYNDGSIEVERYYQTGELHRVDGSASISYNEYGFSINTERYYKHGVEIDLTAFTGLTPSTPEWEFTYDML